MIHSHHSRLSVLKTRSHLSGFTLLELMVVVLIIALVMTTVTMNVRIGEGDSPLKKASDRLLLVTQLLSEEAVLLNTSLGIKFNSLGYDVYRLKYVELKRDDKVYEYDKDGNLVEAKPEKDWRWVKVGSKDKNDPMRGYVLPEGLSFDVAIEGVDIVLDEPNPSLQKEQAEQNVKKDGTRIKPTLFITPDAEIFPDFSIKVVDNENENSWYSIKMNEEGELVLKRAEEASL